MQRYRNYEEYLQSEEWTEKKRLVKIRQNKICNEYGCTNKIQEVHHLRYPKRWGDEPLEWLEGLCRECHRSRHGLDTWAELERKLREL